MKPIESVENPQQWAIRQLTGVPRTLTISLFARHLAGTRKDPIITDPLATDLVTGLGLDTVGDGTAFHLMEMGTAVRTELLDAATRRFVDEHPDTTVVTLGAGLCTRHSRLSDLDVRWVEVDLPKVAELRRELLPPGPGRRIIPGSALNPDWRETVSATTSGPLLFILEGLTMYLEDVEVRGLLCALADHFPGSELLVETVGTLTARRSHRMRQYGSMSRTGARLSWGVQDHAEIAAWHPALELLDTWYYVDHHHDRWNLPFRLARLVGALRARYKIGHFRVRSAGELA